MTGRPAHDLSGQTFGSLRVLHRLSRTQPTAPTAHGARAVWLCVCECGAVAERSTRTLRSGKHCRCGECNRRAARAAGARLWGRLRPYAAHA